MTRTIEELYNRKSVRVYEDREISAEDKEVILKAAVMAPSAGNQQMYTIIDVTDQEIKDKLAVSCDNQPFIATENGTGSPGEPEDTARWIIWLR